MGLILPQKIKKKWNSSKREYYESKGYKYTKAGDEFEVNVEDLTPGAKDLVLVECDVCKSKKQYLIKYRNYYKKKGKKAACENCKSNKKLTIEEIQEIARKKNGECLSKTYENNHSKLKFKCERGHEWEATASAIKSGKWCMECWYIQSAKEKRKYTVEDLQQIAKRNGGKCLSTEYKNIKSKLKWKCNKRHVWETSLTVILRGGWCPTCVGKKKLDIKEMQMLAKSKGGKCLSKEYKNKDTKLEWQCEKGHNWWATPGSIKNRNSWCNECRKNTLEEMNEFAKLRGGECISETYINATEKLKWKCVYGHEFEALYNNLKKGSWCTACKFQTEEKCRYIFEKLTKLKFPRTNQIIKPYQLDGHNSKYKIAFEFNGIQHYEQKWYQSIEEFEKRVEDDKIKVKMCKDKGIHLITIPFWENDKGNENIINFIINKITEINSKLILEKNVEIEQFFSKNPTLNIIKEMAKSKGGQCLSNVYDNYRTDMDFKCSNGHIFKLKYDNFKKGTWCKQCTSEKNEKIKNKNYKQKIQEMYEIAKSRNGFCLSNEYLGINEKLEWKCEFGHTWWARPSNVKGNKNKQGSWCPICANIKRNQKN